MSGDTKSILDFRNKVLLAPMVRIGTLPARLVALDYGADYVYTEEIIDLKMLRCKRVENVMLGTVDFIMNDETIAFRTCDREKGRVIFQIGTSDAQRALKVAKMVERDVAAVDLNMGCPKEYSTKGGCGAALLSQPDNVRQILTTLVKNLSIPVTCKMRVLPTMEETLAFVRMVETTGVSAIMVHGRLREERPRHACRLDAIRAIAEAVRIPIIANGGSKQIIKKFADLEKFRQSCGAASVMVARAAQWDPSIFRAAGTVPLHETCRTYLEYALLFDSTPTNIKYNLQQLLHQEIKTPRGQRLLAAGTLCELSSIWDLDDFYQQKTREWTAFKQTQAALHQPTLRTLADGTGIWEQDLRFYKREYPRNITPKLRLHEWARQQGIDKPLFETEENVVEQYFYSVLTIEGTKYASTLWDKSKRAAEQAAAAVFMAVHNMDDGRKEWVARDAPAKDTTAPQQCEKRSASCVATSPVNSAAGSESTGTLLKGAEVKVESQGQSSSGSMQVIGEKVIGNWLDGMVIDDAAISDVAKMVDAPPSDTSATRAVLKRSSSMTDFIDNTIEKQIRLGANDPDSKRMDPSLIDSFFANESKQDNFSLGKSHLKQEVLEET